MPPSPRRPRGAPRSLLLLLGPYKWGPIARTPDARLSGRGVSKWHFAVDVSSLLFVHSLVVIWVFLVFGYQKHSYDTDVRLCTDVSVFTSG